MYYDYSTLISEVQQTNETLEITNTHLEDLKNINFAIGALILAYMCWKFFKSSKAR